MNGILQKFAVLTLVSSLGFSLASPVLAKSPKAEVAEERSEKAGSRPGLLRDFLKISRAAIGSCTLVSKTGDTPGSTLTCSRDGKIYTILTDSKTQIRRRFWGKATLSEIQIGDLINVIGKWTDEAKTSVQATLIRDLSIQKKNGVFFGDVQSLTGTGWVMTTRRGTETVTVTGTTKFINRREQAIIQADIAVGHRVRVRGVWDTQANTITEVTQVKDFSLPPKLTPTVTPTP